MAITKRFASETYVDETVVVKATEIIENFEGKSGLPEVTEADNNKILQVVNGVWTLVDVMDGNTALFYPDGNEVAY